jgi:uncharacterized integral membrane protein (TIGR00697 family)
MHKRLLPISMLFVAVLLISNIVSTKIIAIGPFSFDWWTLLFPLSYIFGDIITEVYWYKQNRRIIWTWFLCNLLMAWCIIAIWLLPADPSRDAQDAYMKILWLTPRIVLASLIAYAVWEFANSYILAKLKVAMQWKKLWIRTITSTIFWQLLDTLLFVTIAFYWVLDAQTLRVIILSNYIFKVWIEILLTPITYVTVRYLKKADNVDAYDKNTDFNPFHV